MSSSPPEQTTAPRRLSSAGLSYMVSVIITIFIAQVAVILRIICRLKKFRKLAIDDWTIILAQLLAHCLMVEAILFSEKGGLGWPIASLTQTQLTTFFKIFFSLEVTYSFICPLIKISVLLLYRRIFPVPMFKRATLIMVVLCFGWGVSVACISIFQCRPIQGYWNTAIREYCVDSQTFFWGNGISNILLDVMILSLPIPMVWRLQISTKKRLGVIGIFLLGSFVCVASLARITSLGHIEDIDVSASLGPAATWSILEPGFGIISACLPTLRPLFQREDTPSCSGWCPTSSDRSNPRQRNQEDILVESDGITQIEPQHRLWRNQSNVSSTLCSSSGGSTMRKASLLEIAKEEGMQRSIVERPAGMVSLPESDSLSPRVLS